MARPEQQIADVLTTPTTPRVGSWQQGDMPMNQSTRQRDRRGREGTLGEVAEKAVRQPTTRLGGRDYGSTVEMLQNMLLSGNPEYAAAARKMFAELTPAERQTIETLIVQAMPNPQANSGLSEGAREMLGALNGSPLSPERQRAIQEVAEFEGFSWDQRRPDAPLTRTAPEDRLPPTTEDGIVPRPAGLSDKVADSKETRPVFRGPNEDISIPAEGFVAPPLLLDQRLAAGKRFDAIREQQKQDLRRLMSTEVAGKGKRDSQGRRFLDNGYIRKTINSIFPGMGKEWAADFADEVTSVINSNDVAAVNKYVDDKFPALTREQRDEEIDKLWQQHNERKYQRERSAKGSEWGMLNDDRRRIDIARKQENGEPLTPKERELLRQSVGGVGQNRSRMDVGEESDHQQFVRNLVETLGYRPGFDPNEYQAGISGGRPSRTPQNVATGVGRAEPSENIGEEFDPAVIAEGNAPGFAPTETTKRPKPPRKVGKGPRSDELSSGALDNLFARLVVDVDGGQNSAAVRSPAAYGFKSAEDVAQQIIRIANRGGEPVVPPTMIESVQAQLADKIRKKYGDDLGASRIEASKATPDNAITEPSNNSRFSENVRRFNDMKAGKSVPPRQQAPPQARPEQPAGSLEGFDPEVNNERIAAEAIDDGALDSNPFEKIFDDEPTATPSTVRPTPTQVGAPDNAVVSTGATPEDIANARMAEAAAEDAIALNGPDGSGPPPAAPPAAPAAPSPPQPQSVVPKNLEKEIQRQASVIASPRSSGKQLDGALASYEKAVARQAEMKDLPAHVQEEYRQKVIAPLEAAIEARRKGGTATGTPASTAKPSPAPTPAAPTPAPPTVPATGSGPESLDPLEGAPRTEIPAEEAAPRRRSIAEMMEGDVARENVDRGRAAGVTDDLVSEGPLPESTLEAEAARRANLRRTMERRQAALRGEAAAAVPPRASGTPGTPPESAKPVEAATSTEAAATKVDAVEAPRDAEAEKAAVTSTTAAAQADAAAAAARTADATNTSTAPQTPVAGTSSSESRIRQMASSALSAVLNPGQTAMNTAGALVGGGAGWARRNALGLTALGGGIYAANATKDQWMPAVAPYIPDSLEQPISDALQTGADAVGAAGRAVRDFVPRGAPGAREPSAAIEPQMQPVAADAAAQFVEPGLAGAVGMDAMGGRPGMVQDSSVDRIRRMISATRPENQYSPQTPMRATTYYY